MLDDKRIRKTLLSTGLVSESEMRDLDVLAMRRGTSLYRAAITSGQVAEDEVVAHLAGALGVASVSLSNFTAKPKLLALLPPPVVREHRALPVGLKPQDGEETLFLAMDDPHDLDALEAVGQCTPHPLVPLLAGPIDLDEAIDRVYPARNSVPSGDEVTVPPVGGNNHDIFGNVLDDLEHAQANDMLSALSLLDDIPRNRHDHVTPTEGLLAVDRDPRREPPTAPVRPVDDPGGRTDFGRPGRDRSMSGFMRSGPANSALGWRARDGDDLARALARVLLERGVITEAQLKAALEDL